MKVLKTLAYGTMAVIIVMMMAATVLEKLRGTPAAMDAVYHNPLFIALWVVAAVSGMVYAVRRGMPKRVMTFCLHISFVVILCGAFVTHFWGETGSIHLRQGETGSEFEKEDSTFAALPFTVRLDEFSINYHHGSKMPSDYISEVTVLPEGKHAVISMNNILKYKGYRFYQADYDEDGLGSILAVSHDPWGVGITYAGYLLLLISMIGFFFQKESAFRSALRRVAGMTAALLVFAVMPAMAKSPEEKQVRQAMGDMFVYYGHRICPFDDYLREKGFEETFEQLESAKLFPVADSTGTVGWYAASDDLPEAVFENYELWNFIRKSPELIRLSVQQGETADAVKILSGIKAYQQKTAASLLPGEAKVRAEKLYIRIARPRVQFMLSLALGILLFVLNAVYLTKRKRIPEWILWAAAAVALLLWLYLTAVIGLRWWVSGTGPYVGRYNVMMLMAWFATLAIVLLSGKFPLSQPLGFLVAGFTMLLASKAGVSPQIMPLMPVLQSPLLSIHVLSMMLSYTLFGLVAFNGIMGVAVSSTEVSADLRDVSLVLLYPAVFLLTFGTFLGAVWANISWGSYWAWDPKETWALVTMLVYSMTLHGDSLKLLSKPRFFHWFTILAFLCVLITYFGVNLLLGGMHSYA